MIILELMGYPFIILFGVCTFIFFNKLLGAKYNTALTLIVMVTYAVLIDYLLLGVFVRNNLLIRAYSPLQYYFGYFIHMSISQICFVVLVMSLFKGKGIKKIAVCSVFLVIWQISIFSPLTAKGIGLIAERLSFNNDSSYLLIIGLEVILRYLFSSLLLILISKRCETLKQQLPPKISALLIIPTLFILFALEIVGLTTLDIPILFNYLDVITLYALYIFGIVSELVVVFGINNAVSRLLATQHLEMQLLHYRELEAGNKKLKEVRHDIKNHLIAMRSLLNDGNVEATKEYLNKLSTESGLLYSSIQTGNNTIDALLNSKYIKAQDNSINFQYDVRLSSSLPLDDFGLCVILGNAIDNALEACQRIKENERFIHITITTIKKHTLIQIKNSVDENEVVNREKDTSVSDGIGLGNIRDVVNKNNGTMDIQFQNNVFDLSIMFPPSIS